MNKLARLGLDTEHGQTKKGFFISDFSDIEQVQIAAAGFDFEVLIPDVQAHYVEQNKQASNDVSFRNNDACLEETPMYDTPTNFNLGSMGGFFTYQEMLDILDDMAAQYPDLISVKQAIGSITTHEGNPIYWIKVSDNPNVDENEPEVLYTALHHAREPMSLSQMIFFLWHILENYATNPEIQYLVDETELYFIPCINPDGYLYNQSTNPQGGGLWRKNRRNNGSSFGVDLNRNYGYEWAYDNTGSSPNSFSDTYRGPSAFSEPETQAVRDFCDAHEFVIALNYHSHGNLLIHPWGFSDMDTDDALTFDGLGEGLTLCNHYFVGTGTETVGYTVNGDSDDWMYGEATTKPSILTYTPEVGPSFWPPSNEIIDLSKQNVWQNLMVARSVHKFGHLTDTEDLVVSALSNEATFNLKRYGLADGDLTVSLQAISSNIINVGAPKTFSLANFETISSSILYELSPSIESGEAIVFQLTIDNGLYTNTQTFTKYFGTLTPLLEDAANTLIEWDYTPNWGLSNTEFYSPNSSITDSPTGNYPNNATQTITMKNSLTLTDPTFSLVSFWAKWDIEQNWDYVQVQLSVNDGNFVPLCGKYTLNGTGSFQPTNDPVYHGIQSEWVREEINISPFLEGLVAPEIKIRFLLRTDQGVTEDGFYFDDFKIESLSNSLAVETIDFQAFLNKNQQVQLHWTTSTSNDIEQFILQHATAPNQLSDLITIPKNLNLETYTFLHENPAIDKNYYRLCMLDAKGKRSYSDVKSVDIKANQVNIYPTPATNYLQIELPFSSNSVTNLKIHHLNGQLIYQEKLPADVTTFSLDLTPIHALTKGLFILKIETDEKVWVEKFIRN